MDEWLKNKSSEEILIQNNCKIKKHGNFNCHFDCYTIFWKLFFLNQTFNMASGLLSFLTSCHLYVQCTSRICFNSYNLSGYHFVVVTQAATKLTIIILYCIYVTIVVAAATFYCYQQQLGFSHPSNPFNT